jgi:cell division septum initiation protein DivIVA
MNKFNSEKTVAKIKVFLNELIQEIVNLQHKNRQLERQLSAIKKERGI